MKLHDLLSCAPIAIQCHNNPDADALASGYGLYRYFSAMGETGDRNPSQVKFFYGGPAAITKPNLKAMVEDLAIPVEYAPDLKEWPGLLITADCQYGAGNVARVTVPRVAVIDHHIQEGNLPPFCDLRPWLGSCSTLVWKLLSDEEFSLDLPLSTALYYGLFTDTGGFSEVRHPLDRDMWDALAPDQRILKKLKRSNLSLNDLTTASSALRDLHYDAEGRFMIMSAPPCDPNLLGFVSDFAMQVDAVDLAVVFSKGRDGIKFSVRTAVREVRASELASWLAGNMGSGGGHRDKAGGYLAETKYAGQFGDRNPVDYFSESTRQYLETYRIIDCAGPSALIDKSLNMDAMRAYRKLPVRLGFVPCHKLFEGKANLQLRMLEGDLDITVDEDTILMIGIKGEVYPVEFEKFIESYTLTDEPYAPNLPYPPTVMNRDTGIRVSLLEYAGACVGGGGGKVWAMRLESGVRVFTRWDAENYFRGDPGDRIVARSPDDLYVVTADVFDQLYIRDFSEEDIAASEHSARVVKKDIPVPVVFASEDGICETREGAVSYRKGDALLTGPENETWPVARERFEETYAPLPGTISGTDGAYHRKALPAWALQVNEPFMVELSGGKGILRGEPGDRLLQYAPGDYGIVGRDIFEATCDTIY